MEGGWGAGPWGRASWGTAWWEPAIADTVALTDSLNAQAVFSSDVTDEAVLTAAFAPLLVIPCQIDAAVTVATAFPVSVVYDQALSAGMQMDFSVSAQYTFTQTVPVAFVSGGLFSTHTPVIPPAGNPWDPAAPDGAQVWTPITPDAGGIWAVESSTGAQSWGNIEPVGTPDWVNLN